MITNERQYKITRAKADEVRVELAALDRAPHPEGVSPEMREMQFEALRGTLGDLEAELADYDALHDATLIEATGIGEFPTALIRARIARGLTQRELAERVGLAEQAIQRYEAGDYAGVSLLASSRSPKRWTSPCTTTSASPLRAERPHPSTREL